MKISHTVRVLITSDFLINSGFSVFAPVFAVFITQQINNGSLEVVGFATAIAQIFKVVFQIPVAHYLDKNHGEYDDFYSLVAGSTLAAMVPFLYFFARTANHIYIIQAIYGISLALAVPPWFAIFTRHIDKMQENIEWSFESVAIGVSAAVAASLGGFLAQRYGFENLFLLGGCLAMLGAVFQWKIFHDLKMRVARGQVKPLPDRTTSA
ncbi:MAG: MFS transporter [Patescibacteria group bacterium]